MTETQGLSPTNIHLYERRLCPVRPRPRPAGCAAAPAGRSLPAAPAQTVPRGRTERGREGTTRSDSHPRSHPRHLRCPARARPPGGSSRARCRCRCQARPRYLPAPRPCSGRARHPEPEPSTGPAATGSAGQPRGFRGASVPALPAGLVRTRTPWSRCPAPFPGRCRPQLSRRRPAGPAPHRERRRRLGLSGRGEEKRSGKRPILARLLAGGVAQWAGALLRCWAGGGWRWRRRRRAG